MHHLLSTSIVTSIIGFVGVMLWRVREGRSPVTLRKIVIPPLGMATGFCMFLVPAFRIPWYWGALAFLTGAVVLAYPLLLTSNLVREGEAIMVRRSNAFFLVIVVLFLIRFLARNYLDRFISIQQSAALFFVLAFGMIVHWRMRMLLQYRNLSSQVA